MPRRAAAQTADWEDQTIKYETIETILLKTILFPQDMIQDIYKLHWNIIHKTIEITWNVGPYKLIRLPGHPNLNLNLT